MNVDGALIGAATVQGHIGYVKKIKNTKKNAEEGGNFFLMNQKPRQEAPEGEEGTVGQLYECGSEFRHHQSLGRQKRKRER